VTRASQDWVGRMSRLREKSHIGWEGPELINGGTAHPFRLAFWGEGNGPVTFGRRSLIAIVFVML